jgi:hypothetical protein
VIIELAQSSARALLSSLLGSPSETDGRSARVDLTDNDAAEAVAPHHLKDLDHRRCDCHRMQICSNSSIASGSLSRPNRYREVESEMQDIRVSDRSLIFMMVTPAAAMF